jgi:hypothetical protein
MVDQIRKPGVNITQVVGGTPPTPVTATLVPCIVGPAYEVVELIGDDGTASTESQVSTSAGPLLYKQLPVHIATEDYPTPRADSSQMSVLVPEVEVALQRTGDFNILDRNPGTAFLKSANYGTRPGIFISRSHLANNCKDATFIVLVDTSLTNNAASFVVNNGVLDNGQGDAAIAEEILDNIIGAVTGTSYVEATLDIGGAIGGYVLYSTRFGATASISLVSVSGGATATMFNNGAGGTLQYDGSAIEKIRVQGGGFYAEDNVNPTILTSSVIKHTPGIGQVHNGSLDTLDAGENQAIGNNAFVTVQIDIFGDIEMNYASNVVNFNDDFMLRAATPQSNGDLFTASGPIGQAISNVMITEIQDDYIKLGIVNTQRSIYDAEGNPQHQVYTDFQLGTLSNPVPFAPKNGYFTAQSLREFSDGIIGPATQATHIGDPVAISVATGAMVELAGWTADASDSFSGLALNLKLTIAGVSETIRLPFIDNDENANLALWAPLLNGKIAASYNANSRFEFTTIATGSNVNLQISGSLGEDIVAALLTADPASGAFVNGAQSANNGVTASDFGTDDELAAFTGKKFIFYLNDGPTEYSFVASGTSIAPFVRTVNDRMGYEALSYAVNAGNATFTLKSYLFGVASKVAPKLDELGTQALGFADAAASIQGTDGSLVALSGFAEGTGRPNPDVFVHQDGNIVIGGDIMRNTITGYPVSSSTSARIHVAYRALRLDLTPSANVPGIIRVSSIDTLQEVFGPISNRNPFALALYFALLNSGDGVEINAIGVDDVSEAEPNGTVVAYASAAEFLRSYEVYSIVPLTQDENVIALFDNHVTDMSKPELRAERTVISAPANPERYNDIVVLSTGEVGAESTGVAKQVDLNDSPEAILNGMGIDTSEEIPFQFSDLTQLYLHITVGDSSYKYSVESISGGRVSFRTVYTSSQNGDGFYSTELLPSEFVGAEFSLALRGAPLTIAGTGLLNKTAYAETIRNGAQQYLNRRQIRLYPDTVVSDAVGGINQQLPSYYFAAALAGMVANIDSQEPLTRVPMVGFNEVFGPALDRNHLNIISAGNAVIEPESEGANPSLRMQGSTDPSTIESREWSVTRAVDAFSKTLRNQLKSKIGRFNITQAYIDDLSMLVDSMCTNAVNQGQFRGADVIKLEQDVAQPDTILVEIQLEVLYPANYINVTLVV